MNLKYKKVNVTYKTKLLRAQGTCLQCTLLFICTCFPASHSVCIPDTPIPMS